MKMEEEAAVASPKDREVEVEEEGLLSMGLKRIFVGGLGSSVTSQDLEKTFSSLGTVKGVEIVRTNGRSFAYMDFQPSSLKSLSKLFSMYNGCIWKGGRLRLENAKEHYLVRLRKEWEADAELAKQTSIELDPVEKMDSSEQSKLVTPEKKQLHMFFPRLRKVKALPYSGTGKHKYSFRRIEVPSLPINFCDCEEHYGASEAAKEKPVSANEDQNALMNEEELNMMKSVMNNILKREVNASVERSTRVESKVATERENSKQSIDDVPVGLDEMDQETDGDNLVINMVGGGNSRLSQELGIINQELRKGQPSNVDPTENKIKTQKGMNSDLFNSWGITSKKSHITTLVSDRDESTFRKSKKRNLETCPEESQVVIEAQSPEQKRSIHPSSTGLFWRQKSSWKELVGETANRSFSISQILSDSDTKQNLQKPNSLDSGSGTDSEELMEPVSGTDSEEEEPMKLVSGTESEEEELMKPVNGTESEHEELMKPVSGTDSEEELMKPVNGKSTGDCSESLEIGKDVMQDNVIAHNVSTVAPAVIPSKESESPKEVEALHTKASFHTARGHSWLQKSSWRELVGDTNNSFSISQVLPGIATMRRDLPNSVNIGTANFIDIKQQNSTRQSRSESKKCGGGTGEILLENVTSPCASVVTSLVNDKGALAGFGDSCNKLEKYPVDEKIDINTNSTPEESKNTSTSKYKRVSMGAGVGEFCPFMRSNASEKEWTKLRATLSGSLKKKSIEK